MKHLATLILLSSSLLILTASCRKHVEKVDTAYIGEWVSPSSDCDHFLTIDGDSRVRWRKSGSSMEACDHDSEGRFLVGEKTLKVGAFKFKIKESPTLMTLEETEDKIYQGSHFERNGLEPRWRMRLECVSFYCLDGAHIYYRE